MQALYYQQAKNHQAEAVLLSATISRNRSPIDQNAKNTSWPSQSPIRILLFGSHAKGTARPDSDLDLLIIEESDLPRYRRSGRYRRVLCGVFPAKILWVRTPQEVERWKAVPNAFISTALAEGKLLYER